MLSQTILVVMPVYNSEATLENAIQSILRQKHSNLILTIVDDCSTDGSLDIAKKFLSDPRVSVYKNKKNMGAYYSRNFGLYINRNRNWSYFTTHDADDTSHHRRYSILLKYLKGNSNAVQDIFARKLLTTKEILDEQLTMAHAVFTKDVFDNIGYFDDVRFGGDWEHWARLKKFNEFNKKSTAACRMTLGDSFIHDKNLTVLIPIGSKKRKQYIVSVLKRLKKISDPKNLYREFQPITDNTVKILK